MTNHVVTPIDIKVLQKIRMMEIMFDDGKQFQLPCEYLRVFTPSAETRGHGENYVNFPRNKQTVNIISLEPVGHYAIKIYFDDGHNTGIYSWNYLYELGIHQEQNWQQYQASLQNLPT